MATKAIIGRGSVLAYAADDVVPIVGAVTPVAEIFNIGGPNIEGSDVEASNLDSPGLSREFIAGLEDPSELTFTANFTREAYDDMLTIKGETRAWRLTYRLRPGEAVASKTEFVGYLKTVGQELPDGDKVTNTFAIKISGEIEFTPGTD